MSPGECLQVVDWIAQITPCPTSTTLDVELRPWACRPMRVELRHLSALHTVVVNRDMHPLTTTAQIATPTNTETKKEARRYTEISVNQQPAFLKFASMGFPIICHSATCRLGGPDDQGICLQQICRGQRGGMRRLHCFRLLFDVRRKSAETTGCFCGHTQVAPSCHTL